jgi:hypothetical protein
MLNQCNSCCSSDTIFVLEKPPDEAVIFVCDLLGS